MRLDLSKPLVVIALTLSMAMAGQTTYYFTGVGNLADPSRWSDVSGGGGNSPSDFTTNSDDIYDLEGSQLGVVTSKWTVSGTITSSVAGAELTIDDGDTLVMSGSFTNTGNLIVQGQGSFTGTLNLSSGTTTLPEISRLNLQLGSGTATASAAIDAEILSSTVGNGTLNMSTFALTVNSVSVTGGTIYLRTANTSATPISAIVYPSGIFIEFYANAAQTIPSGTEFQGGARFVDCDITLSENIDVDSFLQIQGDATFDAGTHGFVGSAAISGSGTSTFTTANVGGSPFPANSSFYNLTFDGAATQGIPSGTTVSNTLTLNSGFSVSALGNLEAASISFQSNSSLDMLIYQLKETSSVTFSGTHTFRSGYVHASNLPYPNGLNFNNSGVTVELYGSGNQQIPDGSVYTMNLKGSGVKTLDSTGVLTVGSSGGAMNIDPGVAVDVATTAEIDFNGSTLTLNADATGYAELRMLGTLGLVNSPSFVKEFYLDLSSPRWVHMGTGLSGADLQDLNDGATMISANDATGSVFTWDASTSSWTNPSLTGNSPEAAYAIYAGTLSGVDFLRSGSGVVSTQGTALLTADASVTLNYDNSGAPANFTTSTVDGWNFVANPYAASYDWEAHPAVSNLDDAVYVWDGVSGNYTSYVNGVGANLGTQYIAPGQGFFVRAQNGSVGALVFDIDNTVADQSPTFFKKNDVVYVSVSDSNSHSLDETVIRFEPQSTMAFDGEWDAYKMINGQGVPNLYVQLQGEDYSICSTPNSIVSFPLALDANGANQPLTIQADNAQLTSFTKVFLEDKVLDQWTELSNSGSYTFTSQTSDPLDRFEIHFANSAVTLDEYNEEAITFGYGESGIYVFNSAGAGEAVHGNVIDALGRVVIEFQFDALNRVNVIPSSQLSTGIYFIQSQVGDEVVTGKIVVE